MRAARSFTVAVFGYAWHFAGDLTAMLKYGACLELGRGIEQDEETALLVYEEAARLGSAVAMNNIGEMVREGRGREKDPAFAASWFRSAPVQLWMSHQRR